jgi:TRAP-type C4-dicarboxylate transport system substrate-binding protein
MRALSSLLFVSLLAPSLPARAEVEIKLGTLAPKGSPWESLLKEMSQKWAEASGGQVKLRIYPGGVMGDEGVMVRKMRVGQLQAASITTVGMHDITPEPQAVDVPMGIESFDELDYVMGKMEPKLDAALEKAGYVAINWSDVGFVQFFSAKDVCTPDKMRSAKIFAWDGDPKSVDAMKAAGMSPVVLSGTDVLPSLSTGLIDTIAAAPLYAFTARFFQKANHICDLKWAVLTGATVVKKEAWDKISPDVRAKLLAISKDFGHRISLEVRKLNDDAVAQMKSQGLTQVSSGDVNAWRKVADDANKVVRGGVVPAALFDEVITLRNEYRKSHGK